MQVCGESPDYVGTPPGMVLAFEDLPADVPIEQNELAINGYNRLHLGGVNTLLQIPQKLF